LHARWHVGTDDWAEAEARKEAFRSSGQEVDGCRSSLARDVQGSSDNSMPEPSSPQRVLDGHRSEQRSVRVDLKGRAGYDAALESRHHSAFEGIKQAIRGQPVVGE
jgi:hypothetical protein